MSCITLVKSFVLVIFSLLGSGLFPRPDEAKLDAAAQKINPFSALQHKFFGAPATG
jgi:hypothetical protein